MDFDYQMLIRAFNLDFQCFSRVKLVIINLLRKSKIPSSRYFISCSHFLSLTSLTSISFQT